MGNGPSVEDLAVTRPEYGYHVLKISPNSPGHAAALEPFFDFIVSVEQQLLDAEDTRLVDALSANIGKPLRLGVYSTKVHDATRAVQLTPRNDWGGAGLLGVSIRFCSLKGAAEQVWHVVQVYAGSPAFKAGLIIGTDYIVGTPDTLFNEEDDLYALLESNRGKPVPLYVYSTINDSIRLVSVTPGDWSGEGLLGCELGYGLLHRIPATAARQSATASTAGLVREQLVSHQQHAQQQHAQQLQARPATAPPKIMLATRLEKPVPIAAVDPADPPSPRQAGHTHTHAHGHDESLRHSMQAAQAPRHPAPEPALHYAKSAPAIVLRESLTLPVAALESHLPAHLPHAGEHAEPPALPSPRSRELARELSGHAHDHSHDHSHAHGDDCHHDAAPSEPAPPAPGTPVAKSGPTVAPETPVSASKPSLDDHKKKLAALQQQLETLRSKPK